MISARLFLLLLCAPALAQPTATRDPTEPPPIFRAKPGAAHVPVQRVKPEHLVTVDGQRYLMWKGRRYGLGDSVEGARIERLDETEVWLRSDGDLRKLPLYSGVEKLTPRNGASNASVPQGTVKGRTQ